jgi:hypothetical protein
MTHARTFKKILKILALPVITFVAVGYASALTISPAKVELGANPGDIVEETFTIINEQSIEQTYYTSIENFEAQGESGTPNFTREKIGLASWVDVTEKVVIKPGEKIKIPFKVKVPQDADAGGHFAAIFLSTVPPTSGENEVSVGAKIGMLMMLRVSGDIKEEGGVLSFFLKGEKKLITTLPVDFIYRFNNNGGDRVKPTGDITVKNMIGMTTVSLNANKNEGNVLPGSIRRFEVRWGDEDAPATSASFFTFVKYEMRNFALGVYSAKLNVTFGNSGSSVKSLYLFVFPWHLMVVVLVICLVIFALLRLALKRYNAWIIKQARLASGK